MLIDSSSIGINTTDELPTKNNDENNGWCTEKETTPQMTASQPYTTILGVNIDYSDTKAVAGMEIVEVWGSYLPNDVLGMTDCATKIWIRYGLGYLKKHVLIHEIEHVKDPAASEYTIRMRAKQRVPLIDYLI